MTGILRQSTPVAKKDYKCFWCGLQIPKGLKHSYEVQVFNGEFNVLRAYSCCAELFREYVQDDFYCDYGMTPNDFISEVRERNNNNPHVPLYPDVMPLKKELWFAKSEFAITQTF